MVDKQTTSSKKGESKDIIMTDQGWFIDSYVGNIKQVYSFERKLSSGAFSVVFLVKHRKTCK